MNEEKRVRYEAISEKITQLAGGRENIVGLAHCATRLRLVLADNEKADIKAMEEVDLVKGVFVAGDQVQIIFGTGLVNDVCEVMGELNHMNTMSLGDLKTKAGQKMNPLQKALKALSDVFIEIMPGILAAALLTGLSSVLGNLPAVESNQTLYGIVRLINISSGAIFGFLPLCVAYSTVKRFGGRPIMGIVIGCIMLSNSLADAYAAAQGTVDVTTLHIFGFNVELVGFQGGIIVALLIGIVTAKLDQFFEKKSAGDDSSPRFSIINDTDKFFPVIPSYRTNRKRTGIRNHSRISVDDKKSWYCWLCCVLRCAAAYCYYRTSSCVWSYRDTAFSRYRKKLLKSINVCSNYCTGWSSTWIHG